jgi:nucleoside-diphosphate-sugar epimerase/predicted dehydrogenase
MTPPASHAELTVQEAEAGCHILVEKPMALSVTEADRMIAAAAANNVKLGAVHNYLFKPSILKARRLVDTGVIGSIVHVEAYYGLSGEGGAYANGAGHRHWAQTLPGGPFTNFLPHMVYLMLAFLGASASVDSAILTGSSGEGNTEMNVLFSSPEASGTMTISMRAKPYAKFMDIYGTKGTIHADLVREICVLHQEGRMPRMISKVFYSLEDVLQTSKSTIINSVKVATGKMKNMPELQLMTGAFYRSLASDGEPPVTGEAGRTVVSVMEAIWAKTGAPNVPQRSPVQIAETLPLTHTEQMIAESRSLAGKVLVTGATGFLGHRLVNALARSGVQVRAFVRDLSQVSPELEQHVELVCGDLRDPSSMANAMQGINVVFHCAAVTANNVAWKNHYETNVQGTASVLQAALEARVKRVVYASSVIVYGIEQRRLPVREDDLYALNSDKWAYYLRSKLEADKLALAYWKEHKLPVSVLRLGILYGPGGNRAVGRGLLQLGPLRFLVGTGNNRLPFTYVDNAVNCMLLAAVCPEAVGQAYNVVDEPQVRLRDIAYASSRLAGERLVLLPIPPKLLYLAANYLESRSDRANSEVPPKLTNYVLHSACRNITYDSHKAREQLGWQPEVTLEEGLRRTMAS